MMFEDIYMHGHPHKNKRLKLLSFIHCHLSISASSSSETKGGCKSLKDLYQLKLSFQSALSVPW